MIDDTTPGWNIWQGSLGQPRTGVLGVMVATNCNHRYWSGLLGYEVCLDGHIRSIDDIENAVKYANNSKHLPKSQNTINDIHMSSHDSVIIRLLGIVYGSSIVGAVATVLVVGALKPAWSECFL
jgi:hypothetical protein